MKIKRIVIGTGVILLALTPFFSTVKKAGANSYFGGNGRLVFYSPVTLDDNTQEIYTVKPDGTDLKRITNDSLPEANPQWAPSGTKIAYDKYVDGTNQQDIYIQNINSDGSANGAGTVLSGANTTEREFDPSWSPDGTKIAFHRRGDVGGNGPYQIFTIPASGGSPTRITNDDTFADTEPTWSKNGDFLAFGHRQISDDSRFVAISASTASTPSATFAGSSPQWSPVANKVVFSNLNELWVYDKDADDADGTNASDNITQLTQGATSVSAPTWSPDGKLIATTGSGGSIVYYSATDGSVVATKSVATSSGLSFTASENTNELDWARATAPANTTHECTTNVNTNCTSFNPTIPSQCQTVITSASHGTPQYADNAFSFMPEQDYVGDDSYVYQYYDENMNAITCTVNIHVLPGSPNTGAHTKPTLLVVLGGASAAGFALVLARRRFALK